MKAEREGRPAVISASMTASMTVKLQEYLGFWHVVRSLYGYELNLERIAKLVSTYPEVWHQFEREIQAFVIWLKALAVSLAA